MAEATGKGKLRRILGRAGLGLLSLVLMAAVYVGAVLIHSPESEEGSFVVQEEPEAVTRLQASSSDDPAALARLFGARLPVVPGLPMTGETRNASHDGQAARMAILRYNGATLSAVRPAGNVSGTAQRHRCAEPARDALRPERRVERLFRG